MFLKVRFIAFYFILSVSMVSAKQSSDNLQLVIREVTSVVKKDGVEIDLQKHEKAFAIYAKGLNASNPAFESLGDNSKIRMFEKERIIRLYDGFYESELRFLLPGTRPKEELFITLIQYDEFSKFRLDRLEANMGALDFRIEKIECDNDTVVVEYNPWTKLHSSLMKTSRHFTVKGASADCNVKTVPLTAQWNGKEHLFQAVVLEPSEVSHSFLPNKNGGDFFITVENDSDIVRSLLLETKVDSAINGYFLTDDFARFNGKALQISLFQAGSDGEPDRLVCHCEMAWQPSTFSEHYSLPLSRQIQQADYQLYKAQFKQP